MDRVGRRVSRETLADDDLDATDVVARAPVVLVEQLAAERREFEGLELALLRHLCRGGMVSLIEEVVLIDYRRNAYHRW